MEDTQGICSRWGGVEIVALCSQPKEEAARLGNDLELSSCRVFEDFDEMMTSVSFDLLYICVPPYVLTDQPARAASKGIHVFMEKPIGLDLEVAARMVAELEKSGVVTQVGYHFRFGSAVKRVHELMASGQAGRPCLFQALYSCNSLHTSWWRDVTKSGGQIMEQIIHYYDLALHLFGDVKVASAAMANVCHRNVPGYTVEDNSACMLVFENSATGVIAASNCGEPGKWGGPVTLICENIVATIETPTHGLILHKTPAGVVEERIDGSDNPYLEEDRAFLQAVRAGTPSPVPAREGLKTLQLTFAAVRSAENNSLPVAPTGAGEIGDMV